MSHKGKGAPHQWNRFHVGIDAGSVSINCVVINQNKEIVYESPYRRHLGKVEERVAVLIQELYAAFGKDRIESVSFTGNHGKNLAEKLGMYYEFETISQVSGALFIRPTQKQLSAWEGRIQPFPDQPR